MDRLEKEMGDRMRVIRLDLNSPAGRLLGQRWEAAFTPTFIVFDAAGMEVMRNVGRVDPTAVKAAVSAP